MHIFCIGRVQPNQCPSSPFSFAVILEQINIKNFYSATFRAVLVIVKLYSLLFFIFIYFFCIIHFVFSVDWIVYIRLCSLCGSHRGFAGCSNIINDTHILYIKCRCCQRCWVHYNFAIAQIVRYTRPEINFQIVGLKSRRRAPSRVIVSKVKSKFSSQLNWENTSSVGTAYCRMHSLHQIDRRRIALNYKFGFKRKRLRFDVEIIESYHQKIG